MARDKIFETVVIGAAIVFFVGLSAGLLLFDFFTPAKMLELTGGCAPEGAEIGSSDSPDSCCRGLSPMPLIQASKDCSNIVVVSEASICSNCGDGICALHHNENKCTCPEDCLE